MGQENFYDVGAGFGVKNVGQKTLYGFSPATHPAADIVSAGSVIFGNSSISRKAENGAGSDKWIDVSTQNDLQDIKDSNPWRDPVLIATENDLASVLADAVAGNPVQGRVLVDLDRVLFISPGGANNKNVYVFDATDGVFAEDTNDASISDTIYTFFGDFAGVRFTFNNAGEWKKSNASNLDEQGFQSAFIGKDGPGSEMPNYHSTHNLSQGVSLEFGIGEVDESIGAPLVPVSRSNNKTVATATVQQNISAVDKAIGINPVSTKHVKSTNSVNQNLSVLDAVIGAIPDGDYVLSTNNVGANMALLSGAIKSESNRLDARIDSNTKRINISGQTSGEFDIINVQAAQDIQWRITAIDTANPGNKISTTISVLHDGTASTDATVAGSDPSEGNFLSVGAGVNIVFDLVLNGTGAGQTASITFNAAVSVDLVVTRTFN